MIPRNRRCEDSFENFWSQVCQTEQQPESFSPNNPNPSSLQNLGTATENSSHARYLNELVKEFRILRSTELSNQNILRHTYALLITEIERIWNMIYSKNTPFLLSPVQNHSSPKIATPIQNHKNYNKQGYGLINQIDTFHSSNQKFITLQEKIPIPYHPRCNFIGRILGPRGISVKQLETHTGCHILIRGEGSVKDSTRELRLKTFVGWEHLSEPLHVLINAVDTSYSLCKAKLQRAVKAVKQLLTVGNDEHKRQQLIQLAIINGTYRPQEVVKTKRLSSENDSHSKNHHDKFTTEH